MKKAVRFLCLLLIVALSVCILSSCEKTRVHKAGELSIKLPEKLRAAGDSGGYLLYLSTMECAVTVEEITDKMLSDAGLSRDDGLEELVDAYFEKHKIDKEQCYLTYSEKQNAYKFRYSMSRDDETYFFHYICMIGNDEHIYFIDMFCDHYDSNYYLQEFEKWGNTAKID